MTDRPAASLAAPLVIARHAGNDLSLLPALANRHGLIAGATGTGKTVTLQKLAEQLSGIGVPVFMADVKGDLSGLAAAGVVSPKLQQRLTQLAISDWQGRANPVTFWDVFGEAGHPVRATVSDMGPLLLGRLLNLNDTQAGVLQLVFKIADDQGLLLLDLKDLRAMVQHVGDHAKDYTTDYGNISTASIGAIQRGLLTIEEQGGSHFFGEPMLDIADLMQSDADGRGYINILAADKLCNSPRLYAIFLLWLLSELFEQLPEVGDLDKPKLVFFFDEAHLLFTDAPAALLEKIEQVVRLIRSKGVGIYFVTQNPLDIPDSILGQLGNRVQHALRAFTPRDQKAVKAAADTLRANPAIDAASAITELGVGEALISFLDSQGRPTIVDRALILPPASRIGPLNAAERQQIIQSSLIYGHYEQSLDRESAYERLRGQPAATAPAHTTPAKEVPNGNDDLQWGNSASRTPAAAPPPSQPPATGGGLGDIFGDVLGGALGQSGRSGGRQTVVESVVKSAARAIGSQLGREIVRGVLGSILGGGGSRRR